MKKLIGLFRSHIRRPLARMISTFPFLASDPEEKEWRKEHFREMWGAEWDLLKSNGLFDFLFSKEKRRKRKAHRMFELLNHPQSLERQTADWRKRGPQNPPPKLRKVLERMNEINIEFPKERNLD